MRRRALILALAVVGVSLLSARQASAQVTLDAVASGICNNIIGDPGRCGSDTTLTIAVTVAAGSNRQLAAVLFIGCGGADVGPTVSTVVWDAAGTNQSLAQITSTSPTTARRGYLFALPAGTQPTTGAHTLTATLSGSLQTACELNSTFHGGVFSVAGVDQTTTFTATNTNSGNSTSATMTLSSSGGSDLGIDGACAGSTFSSTTETSKWNTGDGNTSCNASGGATAAGGDTSLSWTVSASDSWVMVGGALKAAAGGAAVTPRLLLLGVGGAE